MASFSLNFSQRSLLSTYIQFQSDIMYIMYSRRKENFDYKQNLYLYKTCHEVMQSEHHYCFKILMEKKTKQNETPIMKIIFNLSIVKELKAELTPVRFEPVVPENLRLYLYLGFTDILPSLA